MAILLQSFDYPPNDGGIARVCSAIAGCFKNRGYSLQVVSQKTPQAVFRSDEIRVSRNRPRRELEAFRLLWRSRSRDLVLSGIWYPEGLLAAVARVERSVVFAHGLELLPARNYWRRGAWKLLLRFTLESASLVVANSQYTAGLVRESAPAAKVVTLPLGVDHRFFTPGDSAVAKRRFQADGKVVISSVSRLHRYKGHDLVLDAVAALDPSVRSRFVYLIAGKGPAQPALEAKVQQLGLASAVRWLGYVNDEDLIDVYRASDLFVLCTLQRPAEQEVEGFGLVFLEAQACGTPVVGTNTGGIPDSIRHGKGGWLIPEDDAGALVRILVSLSEDPGHFRAAGNAARDRIERECTWDVYSERLIEVLRSRGLLSAESYSIRAR